MSISNSVCVAGRSYTDGRGEGGGAKSYAGEKAWSSIIYKSFNTLLSNAKSQCLAWKRPKREKETFDFAVIALVKMFCNFR